MRCEGVPGQSSLQARDRQTVHVAMGIRRGIARPIATLVRWGVEPDGSPRAGGGALAGVGRCEGVEADDGILGSGGGRPRPDLVESAPSLLNVARIDRAL